MAEAGEATAAAIAAISAAMKPTRHLSSIKIPVRPFDGDKDHFFDWSLKMQALFAVHELIAAINKYDEDKTEPTVAIDAEIYFLILGHLEGEPLRFLHSLTPNKGVVMPGFKFRICTLAVPLLAPLCCRSN